MRRSRRAPEQSPRPVVSVLLQGQEPWENEDPDLMEIEFVDLAEDDEAAQPRRLAAGLERASGSTFLSLRRGESLESGGLRRLFESLLYEPAAVAVYPAYRVLDEDGETAEVVVPEELAAIEIVRYQEPPAGPGALVRTAPAREAARAAADERFGEVAFWARLATRGPLRRIVAPLAARRRAEPEHGGIEAARERLDLAVRLLAAIEIRERVDAVTAAAVRSACVLAASELEPGFNEPGERVCVVDRFGDLDPPAGSDPDAELALLEAKAADLSGQVSRHRLAITILEDAARRRTSAAPWEAAE